MAPTAQDTQIALTTTSDLQARIRSCTLCAARFAQAREPIVPKPVVWYRPGAPVLLAGQAPGMRVYQSGRPFTDRSGARLRDWLGVDEAKFYDRRLFAIVPMGLCFPGYSARGADLPPPPLCAATWRGAILEELGMPKLTLCIGAAAARWHIGRNASLTDHVKAWRQTGPSLFTLPHPSWRNNRWLKDNPWFEAEMLPELRATLKAVIDGHRT